MINRPYNLIENEAASHREIDHHQAENKWRSQESEDKIAEFRTKSEWKKYKNTLNILSMDFIYVLKSIDIEGKTSVYILKLCQESL